MYRWIKGKQTQNNTKRDLQEKTDDQETDGREQEQELETRLDWNS